MADAMSTMDLGAEPQRDARSHLAERVAKGVPRPRGLCQAALVFLLATAGCTGNSEVALTLQRFDGTSKLRLAINAPRNVTAACEGILADLSTVTFPSLARSARGYRCFPEMLAGDAEVTQELWVDEETGDLVDVYGLWRLDAVSFKEDFAALDPDLRERLAHTPPHDLVSADVWFAAATPEPGDKDELLLGSSVEADRAAGLRAGRRALAGVIDSENQLAVATGNSPIQIVDDLSSGFWAPRLSVRATPAEMQWLGRQDMVLAILPDPGEGKPAGMNYFAVDQQALLDNLNFDGTGVTVAILEGGRFDSTWALQGYASGSCMPTDSNGFVNYLCHCPTTGANTLSDAHSRLVAGVVRNQVVCSGSGNFPCPDASGGMADQARIISANINGGCTNSGPDAVASATKWATNNGARVINRSYGWGSGSPANTYDMLADYSASNSPWPTFVVSVGNDGNNIRASANLRNGLVVGGADDLGSNARTDTVVAVLNTAVNYGGALGMEMPHLAAPAMNVDTAGDTPFETETHSGTSVAAPQVSGIAASLQELNPNLTIRPETLMAGMLAGADEDLTPYGNPTPPSAWPLDLDDNIDDQDGAGLANAAYTGFILGPSARYDSGNSPAGYGHTDGYMTSAGTPAGSFYGGEYNASVPNNQRLRVAAVFLATFSCGSPPAWNNCALGGYPKVDLYIYDGASQIASSLNLANNYNVVWKVNTSGVTKTYKIKFKVTSWTGASNAHWALAWMSQ